VVSDLPCHHRLDDRWYEVLAGARPSSGSRTEQLPVEGGHPAGGREGWPHSGAASNSTTAGDGGQCFGARTEATSRCVLGALLNRIVPLLPNY